MSRRYGAYFVHGAGGAGTTLTLTAATWAAATETSFTMQADAALSAATWASGSAASLSLTRDLSLAAATVAVWSAEDMSFAKTF